MNFNNFKGKGKVGALEVLATGFAIAVIIFACERGSRK